VSQLEQQPRLPQPQQQQPQQQQQQQLVGSCSVSCNAGTHPPCNSNDSSSCEQQQQQQQQLVGLVLNVAGDGWWAAFTRGRHWLAVKRIHGTW
jgi:hypothetical protein